MTFHISIYGKFGGSIPCDRDGFCFTTAREAKRGNWGVTLTDEEAKCFARETREKVKSADAALDRWRRGKG